MTFGNAESSEKNFEVVSSLTKYSHEAFPEPDRDSSQCRMESSEGRHGGTGSDPALGNGCLTSKRLGIDTMDVVPPKRLLFDSDVDTKANSPEVKRSKATPKDVMPLDNVNCNCNNHGADDEDKNVDRADGKASRTPLKVDTTSMGTKSADSANEAREQTKKVNTYNFFRREAPRASEIPISTKPSRSTVFKPTGPLEGERQGAEAGAAGAGAAGAEAVGAAAAAVGAAAAAAAAEGRAVGNLEGAEGAASIAVDEAVGSPRRSQCGGRGAGGGEEGPPGEAARQEADAGTGKNSREESGAGGRPPAEAAAAAEVKPFQKRGRSESPFKIKPIVTSVKPFPHNYFRRESRKVSMPPTIAEFLRNQILMQKGSVTSLASDSMNTDSWCFSNLCRTESMASSRFCKVGNRLSYIFNHPDYMDAPLLHEWDLVDHIQDETDSDTSAGSFLEVQESKIFLGYSIGTGAQRRFVPARVTWRDKDDIRTRASIDTETSNVPRLVLTTEKAYNFHGPAILFCGQHAQWDSTPAAPGTVAVEGRVHFYGRTFCLYSESIEVINTGITAIFYSWMKFNLDNVSTTMSDRHRFYFDDLGGTILPGERVNMNVMFKSNTSGLCTEVWKFKTQPEMCGGAHLLLSLSGLTYKPVELDLARRCREIEDTLEERMKVSIQKDILRLILNGLPLERPREPVKAEILRSAPDYGHNYVFECKNPQLYYHSPGFKLLESVNDTYVSLEDTVGDLKTVDLARVFKHISVKADEREDAKLEVLAKMNQAMKDFSFAPFTVKNTDRRAVFVVVRGLLVEMLDEFGAMACRVRGSRGLECTCISLDVIKAYWADYYRHSFFEPGVSYAQVESRKIPSCPVSPAPSITRRDAPLSASSSRKHVNKRVSLKKSSSRRQHTKRPPTSPSSKKTSPGPEESEINTPSDALSLCTPENNHLEQLYINTYLLMRQLMNRVEKALTTLLPSSPESIMGVLQSKRAGYGDLI